LPLEVERRRIPLASIDGISVDPQETCSGAAVQAGLSQLMRRIAAGPIGVDDDMAGAVICVAVRAGPALGPVAV
jgi:hypothetical protein